MKNDKTIEALLAVDPSTVTAPALKLALEQHRKEQEEKATRQALEYLRNVEKHVEAYVERLRQLRKMERKAKENLEKVVAARDEFHKTGNHDAFSKTVLDL
jgi:hypothetical protein